MNIRQFQILVLPFRKSDSGDYQYAIFSRIRSGLWQAIAGGGGQGETFLEAAVREASEEAGIPISAVYYRLETINSIPIHFFDEPTPEGSYVITEHCFAVDCSGVEIVLSPEHSQFRWADYETAQQMLKWDSNKTALWELNQRLINNKMLSVDEL